METKSRYEVISDLESKKRELIEKRDSLNEGIKQKERIIKELERTKEDIAKQKEDFELKDKNKRDDLDRAKADFEFRIKNTEDEYNRKIVDAKEDLEFFKENIESKKATYEDLIDGVEKSLERFNIK